LLAANAVRAAELQRLDDIQSLGKRFKMEALADRCALEGKTVAETRSALLDEMKKQQDETITTEQDRKDPGAGKEHPIITIHQSVRSFSGKRDEAAKKAYRFANWFIAANLTDVRALSGNATVARAVKYCKDYGINIVRGQVEGENTAGGFLVPHEFNNEMIDLRERFGVGRRNIRIVPMASDSRSQPRRKSGLTAYVIGEGTGATESEKGWDRVQLSTKKIGALARFSSEIAEDGLVNMGDDLASEIAYAFAEFEDTVIFTGDGSKNHARIVGAITALQNLEDGAGAAGVIEATGNTWDEFVLQDFLNVIGAQPEYAETPNVKWYCSKVFWATVMCRIQLAANGNNQSDIASGGTKMFLGYPVEVSQKFPKTASNGKVMTLFGDLRMAGMLGDRRQTTIRLSDQQHWAEEEIDVAGSERFDVNIHDIGDANTAGPLLGLKCKAS
jgi:HK97 family phage major capsid protein